MSEREFERLQEIERSKAEARDEDLQDTLDEAKLLNDDLNEVLAEMDSIIKRINIWTKRIGDGHGER